MTTKELEKLYSLLTKYQFTYSDSGKLVLDSIVNAKFDVLKLLQERFLDVPMLELQRKILKL